MGDEPSSVVCPEVERLDRYVSGELDEAEREAVAQHLESCEACRAQAAEMRENLGTLTRAERLWQEMRRSTEGLSEDLPQLPGYEVLRLLHEGGQGIVYEARQQSTKRIVAIKLMLRGRHASRQQRHRFEREIDLAASLEHPNIVPVFDSGVSEDGRLYLVMRYVEGRPLDVYLREHRPKLEGRLELYERIARAVRYAHQRGVIHRDLKPNNIMVDGEGEPHLLDFGLAKALGEEADRRRSVATQAGEFIGTLAYAAPEQVRGDPHAVDVRSDVYALGVILFEMLTGAPPYPVDVRLAELIDNITEREPGRPSALEPVVDGDLDMIVLKALSKEQERRYQSVSDLLRDLENHRAGRPIEARGDSTWYVMRKALRRHRVPVAAACIVALALVGATATSMLFWRQSVVDRDAALAARDEAEQRAEQLADLSAFTGLRILEASAPWGHGEEVTVIQAMDDVVGLLEETFADEPGVEAQLRHSIGNIYQEAGRYDEADAQLQRAVELRTLVYGSDARETLITKVWLWRLRCRQSRYEEAEAIIFDVIERQRRTTGEIDCAEHYRFAGEMMMEQDRLEEAEPLLRQALELGRQKWEADSYNVIAAVSDLVELLRRRHGDEGVVELCVDSMRRVRPLTAAEEREPIRAMRALAALAEGRAPPEFAESLWRACVEARELHLNDDDACSTAALQFRLGKVVYALDRAEAESILREAVAAHRDQDGPENVRRGLALAWLGYALNGNGKYEEAERSLREALPIYEREYGAEHYLTAGPMSALGAALVGQGRCAEAEPLLRAAGRMLEAEKGAAHRAVMNIREQHVAALVGQGRSEEAADLAGAMMNVYERTFGHHHLTTSKLAHRLEVVLGRQLDRPSSRAAPAW